MNWVSVNMSESLCDFLLSFLDFFRDGVCGLFKLGISLSEKKEIVGAVNATTLLAISLVSVIVLKEIFNTFILETNGNPDGDPFQLIVKASLALALICCNSIIFNYLFKISGLLANDITGNVNPEIIFDNTTNYAKETEGLKSLATILFLIIYIAFTIILSIKAGLRAVELAVMKIIFPIFAIDNITVSAERWNAFFTSYMITFFGYILQILTFTMCIATFTTAIGGNTSDFLLSAAWMYFSLVSPKWIEKFCYSSGLSKGIVGGMRGLMSYAMLKGVRA